MNRISSSREEEWDGKEGCPDGVCADSGKASGCIADRVKWPGRDAVPDALSSKPDSKKEFPEEYAKIEQARLNVEEQLQALAKKADVKLPDTPETMRLKMEQLKNKFPKEFAEVEKLRKEDPRAANEKMRELAEKAGIELPLPPRRRGPKGGPGRFGNPMPELRRRFPEKMRELDKIRRSSPVEYRTEIRELMKKWKRRKLKNKTYAFLGI